MTEEIRKNAEAYIRWLKTEVERVRRDKDEWSEEKFEGIMLFADVVSDNMAMDELKQSLRPSREKIADNLESYLSMEPKISKAFEININYAIEELRR